MLIRPSDTQSKEKIDRNADFLRLSSVVRPSSIVCLPRGHVFDEYPYADGKTAHFYERYRSGELDKKAAGWVNPLRLRRPHTLTHIS